MNKKLKKILNEIGYSIVMNQLTFLSLLGVTDYTVEFIEGVKNE